MKEILNEWHKFLLKEANENEIENLVKQIFEKNGALTLNTQQEALLKKYITDNSSTNALSAGRVADALYVYYRDKISRNTNPQAADYMRRLADEQKEKSKALRGLPQQSGMNPTQRAISGFITGNDPTLERGLFDAKDRPEFAKFITNLSLAIRRTTGVAVLDPTLATKLPEWGKKYPKTWAMTQTIANITASDPITFLSWFVGGGAGKATQQEITLQKAIKKLPEAEQKAVSDLARQELSKGLEKASSAASSGNIQATEQAINLAKEEAKKRIINNLLQYVEGGEYHAISGERANELLNLAKEGLASFFKDKVWRGIRVANESQLFQYIKNATKQEQGLISNAFRQAESNAGKWVQVDLTSTKLSGGTRNFSSWSADPNVAINFSKGKGFLMGQAKGEASKFSIVLETSGGQMIDVHETLKRAGSAAMEEFQAEKEILGIGDVAIKKIWISSL